METFVIMELTSAVTIFMAQKIGPLFTKFNHHHSSMLRKFAIHVFFFFFCDNPNLQPRI